jgi:hypothetical protein
MTAKNSSKIESNLCFRIGVIAPPETCVAENELISSELSKLFHQLKSLMPHTPLELICGVSSQSERAVALVASKHKIVVRGYADQVDPDPNLELTNSNSNFRPFEQPSATHLRKCCHFMIVLWNGCLDNTSPVGRELLSYLQGDVKIVERDKFEVYENNPPAELATYETEYVFWLPVKGSEGTSVMPVGRGASILGGVPGFSFITRYDDFPDGLINELTAFNDYNHQFSRLSVSGELPTGYGLIEGETLSFSDVHASSLTRIEHEYQKADRLALYYQARSDRLFKAYGLLAAVMGMLFLAYEELASFSGLLYAYLAIGGIGFFAFQRLSRHNWFSKFLMYRLVAEALRTKFFVTLAGFGHQLDANALTEATRISQFSGFHWIDNVFRSLDSVEGEIEGRHDQGNLAYVRKSWVSDQCSYFQRKIKGFASRTEKIKRFKQIILAGLLIAVILLLFFKSKLSASIVTGQVNVEDVLIFLMGLLPLWLGIWELFENKMATKELAWQYKNQAALYARTDLQLANATDRREVQNIILDLANNSLNETYLWTVHRYHREYEPPSLE